MKIRPLRRDIERYLKKHTITKKFIKQKKLFEANPFHPSLGTELLEPRHREFYAFRLDQKYRAIFFYCGNDEIEIVDINNHYQ
jgi:Txe/YoeB family toxin of Txe-Axe toxin-antitoxin module